MRKKAHGFGFTKTNEPVFIKHLCGVDTAISIFMRPARALKAQVFAGPVPWKKTPVQEGYGCLCVATGKTVSNPMKVELD